MAQSKELTKIRETGADMVSVLELSASPVGVKLVFEDEKWEDDLSAEHLPHHRYCQAVMLARHGRTVWLDAEGIACPAAAAAFGFKPLPEPLQSGKGLVGFGITSRPEVGEKMFQGMSRLDPGSIKGICLMPLESCSFTPDVIVVEDEVEKLMWVVLAYMHATGGERVFGNTAVLQAACVDSTLIPYLERRLNYGLSCYGCRDATDIKPGEALVGFSGNWLSAIGEHLAYLSTKAIPGSRSKKAFHSLQRDDAGRDSGTCG
ncbi:MAG: DUF169 domain-containing protein [Desulfotignum sp.]|nr:DUF169 domain-containing protein [Desulfotignum sp.]